MKFNLSDKILEDRVWVDENESVIPIEDVKEFIRLLKEELMVINSEREIIDKLAGKDLI